MIFCGNRLSFVKFSANQTNVRFRSFKAICSFVDWVVEFDFVEDHTSLVVLRANSNYFANYWLCLSLLCQTEFANLQIEFV